MDSCRSRQAWLMVGLLWFLLGIAWAPSSKLYQQGLIYLFCVPTLLLLRSERNRVRALWGGARTVLLGIVLLICWGAASAVWSTASEPVREIAHVVYALFFLAGMVLLSEGGQQRLILVMQVAGGGLALSAFVALVKGYGIDHQPWWWRLEGLGSLNHPILGGYVIGLAMVWSSCLPPRSHPWRLVWGGSLLVFLVFMVMTQSRGVWVALLVTMLFMPLWHRGREAWLVSGLLLLVGLVGYWQFPSVVLARGASYRPEILHASLQMIAEHPWLGLGVGNDYQVRVDSLGLVFDHSHNIFTHVAIELGIPGLLCWLLVWGGSFLIAWQQRGTALGSALLGVLLFSTVALLFDGASLWGSPRPEWFLTWLPVGLALGLQVGAAPPSGTGEPLCYHAGPSNT